MQNLEYLTFSLDGDFQVLPIMKPCIVTKRNVIFGKICILLADYCSKISIRSFTILLWNIFKDNYVTGV